MQCLLFLAVGKLDIQHTAISFQHCQGIQFSVRVLIRQRAKMTPVDLYLLSWIRLKTDICLALLLRATQLSQQIPNDGNLSAKAFIAKTLKHHGGFYLWVLRKPLVNQVKIWV